MADSSPPSPTSLFKAQLIVEKSKLANSKSKKTKKTAPGKPKKAAKQDAEDEGQESDKENGDFSDGINWLKNPNDTTRLLGAIEESIRYRKAFGFKGGDVPGVTSGGLTTAQISRDLGEKLFPNSMLPADKLGKAISNRIRTLKKKYSGYHKDLGQTGHGLVVEDRTTEIISGTPIYNVWDKMHVKFPWYKRMHTLLHSSPVYDTSALANSSTPLDTSVLTAQKNDNREHSLDWDDAAIDASFENDRDASSSAASLSPRMELPSPDGLVLSSVTTPSGAVAAAPVKSAQAGVPALSSSDPPATSRKRKDPFQQVQELTATYAQSRLESERLRAQTKRQCLETELNIQQLKSHDHDRQRLHDTEERERQRQHELQLIDKQILLAQLQAGNANTGHANYGQGSGPGGW